MIGPDELVYVMIGESEIDGIHVEIPTALSSSIETVDGNDFYCFYVYQPGLVTFDVDAVQSGSDLDAVLELYDEYGTSLDYSDDMDGYDPYLEVYLLPGLYYLEVKGYASTSIGWYDLWIH